MKVSVIASSFLLITLIACNDQASNIQKNDDKKMDSTNTAATDSSSIKEESVSYNANGKTMKGYVVYDQNKSGKRPGILVVHEWWGLTDYPRMRAKELAKLGYIAMAVDMYGDGKTASNPDEAQKMATPFYKDPHLAKTGLDAALTKLKEYP
ncbi:MAG: dienelactone hydrolase family protein, partial [Flavisolibacter sp.]